MQSNKSFCLIQLTRIGDIIQTTQAAQSLKLQHSNISLTLICRFDFGKQLSFLTKNIFDKIIYINSKDLFSEKSISSAGKKLEPCLKEIGNTQYDVAINLSYNKSSSYLLTLIKATHKLGIQRNNSNQIVINDKWSQYIYSNVLGSNLNQFHLVDIYKTILGATFESSLKPSSSDEKNKRPNNVITLHPFASDIKKMWNSSKWSELIYHLLKNNPLSVINIVGGKEDRESCEKIVNAKSLLSFQSRIHQFVGIYDIEQTFELVKKSSLIVCHDSMVSHLAAINEVPTIVLSLGTVRPDETNPYNPNTLNIASTRKCFPCVPSTQCQLMPCHNDLSIQAVYKTVQMVINGDALNVETLRKTISPFEIDKIIIRTAQISNQGHKLVEISQTSANLSTYFKNIYHMIWSYYLREEEVECPHLDLSKEDLGQLHVYSNGIHNLFELYSFGMNFSKRIIDLKKATKDNISKIQESVEKISEIDRLINLTKSTYPKLSPIIDFFTVIKANASGDTIFEIAQDNLLAYYEAQSITKIIFDLLESTFDMHPHLKRENVNEA